MHVKKQQLEPDVERWTGSKLGKEYIKAVYFHPAWKWKQKSLSCVQLFVTPWTMQSMEFTRPEYWSG